jgi:hypothetical protein
VAVPHAGSVVDVVVGVEQAAGAGASFALKSLASFRNASATGKRAQYRLVSLAPETWTTMPRSLG